MMNERHLFREGQKLFRTGHPKESIGFFTEAADAGCNPVNAYLNRGAAYIAIGEFEKAIVDFHRVLRVDEDNERALYYRGIAYMKIGGFEDAVTDLTKSIELNHDRGVAFFARSIAHAELGNTEESLRDLKTAITFSNIEVEGFMNLFGNNRTLFDKYMALLEGDRGPLTIVLDDDVLAKAERWIQ